MPVSICQTKRKCILIFPQQSWDINFCCILLLLFLLLIFRPFSVPFWPCLLSDTLVTGAVILYKSSSQVSTIYIKIGALNEYEEEIVLWGCQYYDFKLPILWILFLTCQTDKWGLLGNPIYRRTVINTYPGLSLRGRGRGFPLATKNVAPKYLHWQIEEK